MKKAIVLILVLAVACTSVFAADISLGVMQNFLDTSFIADFEFDHFGVEGSVGIPLIWGTASLVDAITKGEDIGIGEGLEMVLLPGVMVNGYWKAFDGQVMDLRLGIQADVIGLFTNNLTSVIGLWGTSVGLDFKFNDRFSANLTGTLPAASWLQFFGEDAAKFGGFAYVSGGNNDIGDVFVIIFGQLLPGAMSEIARISLKWKV